MTTSEGPKGPSIRFTGDLAPRRTTVAVTLRVTSPDGVTEKFANPALMPPSLVLGAEVYYFHDACYRGLIGRVTVFDRALSADELKELAK